MMLKEMLMNNFIVSGNNLSVRLLVKFAGGVLFYGMR